jgi:hypothetical protein
MRPRLTTRWVTAGAACAVLLMAAEAGAQVDDRIRVFDASLDRVWTVTRSTLRGLGWDIAKEDRAGGFMRTDTRRTEGDDFGVYAKGTKHMLEVRIKDLTDGKTAVTIEHRLWKEERILWIDRREDLPTADHELEREILDRIGAAL